jgi:hypothetical protein
MRLNANAFRSTGRRGKFVACLPVLLIAVTWAVASAPSAAAPSGDSARGKGVGTTTGGIKVNAQSGPNGENPTGTVVEVLSGGIQGTVTCLNVVGDTAYIGYSVSDAEDTSGDGYEDVVSVTDGDPDVITFYDATSASQCSTPSSLTTVFVDPVSRGNFKVVNR